MQEIGQILGLGSGVLDNFITRRGQQHAGQTKIDVDLRRTIGGGAGNTLDVVRQLGGGARGVFMTGPKGLPVEIEEDLVGKFRDSVFWRGLEHDRQSFLIEPMCYTIRSSIVDDQPPEAVRSAIRKAALTVVSPMTAKDHAIVSQILEEAQRSILLLSGDQLSDPAECFKLMSEADVTVLNEGESRQLFGHLDDNGILCERAVYGIRKVVVTGRDQVTEYSRKGVRRRRAFLVEANRTIGAGDAFVGGLATALVEAAADVDPLDFALATAAVHVANEQPMSRSAVADMLAQDRRVSELTVARRTTIAERLPRNASLIAASTAGVLVGAAMFGAVVFGG